MKRQLTFIFLLFISNTLLCQTNPNSFECRLNSDYQGFSKNEIIANVSKLNLENYRLQNERTKLVFDNGFEVTLFSANELVNLNLISSAASYQISFPKSYTLPTLSMYPDGRVTTIYKTVNRKFKKGL